MEQFSLDEIALHKMLTVDGVEKAKKKVLNSVFQVWNWAMRVIREVEKYEKIY